MNDTATMDEEGYKMETTLDFAKLIPDEERAVSAQTVEENNVEVEEFIEPLGDMSSEVLAEERAETEPLSAELADASECGCFNPVLGFKGFRLSSGETLFAKICVSPKGDRFVEYCQMYQNGTYSKKIQIKQSQLFEASLGCFGVKKTGDAVLDKRIKRFVNDARTAYFDKLEHPSQGLDIVTILTILMRVYSDLPQEDDGVAILEDPKKLYAKIMQIIEENPYTIFDEHRSYYALSNENIKLIADELNVKKMQLLKKMKAYRFLYLTDCSEGYQTCVRFSPDGEFRKTSFLEWCYCLLKLDYLAKRKKLQDGSASKN